MINFLVAIIVAFSGRQYYNLAIEYGKNKYIFGLVGVVAYLFGIFIGAVLITIATPDLPEEQFYPWCIPFGIASGALIYFWLKRKWNS
ncbi:MAG TPA: hypothetical protein VFE50_15570 [Cyclobacteriaceae bacterium]|nr:hypothetical protein [Cyclobacteriaceae bacterium]